MIECEGPSVSTAGAIDHPARHQTQKRLAQVKTAMIGLAAVLATTASASAQSRSLSSALTGRGETFICSLRDVRGTELTYLFESLAKGALAEVSMMRAGSTTTHTDRPIWTTRQERSETGTRVLLLTYGRDPRFVIAMADVGRALGEDDMEGSEAILTRAGAVRPIAKGTCHVVVDSATR